jgi:hypothetical protein
MRVCRGRRDQASVNASAARNLGMVFIPVVLMLDINRFTEWNSGAVIRGGCV